MSGSDWLRQVEAAEPGLGAGDVSACLPGWVESFAHRAARGEGWDLKPSVVRALAHTLLAARLRAERLVRERDAARRALAGAAGDTRVSQDPSPLRAPGLDGSDDAPAASSPETA